MATSQYLAFVAEHFLMQPLVLHPTKATMIAAALSGRLNITQLEAGMQVLDQRAMADLAALGRTEFSKEHQAKLEQRMLIAEGTLSATAQQTDNFRGKPYEFDPDTGIAVIKIWGTLTRNWGVGPFSGSTGCDGIQIQFLAALGDKDVKAIWFNIDSGGGAVNGIFDLQLLIWMNNQKNGGKKPVWAFASDYAYSAAYALGAACDKFYAPQSGGVGSIGVIAMLCDMSGALEQEGLKVTVVRAGKDKALANGYEAIPERAVKHLQSQVDEVRELFVARVASMRKATKKAVSETEGLDYMSTEAGAIGLIDDVMPEFIAWQRLYRNISR